jgi:hypothetical protein
MQIEKEAIENLLVNYSVANIYIYIYPKKHISMPLQLGMG